MIEVVVREVDGASGSKGAGPSPLAAAPLRFTGSERLRPLRLKLLSIYWIRRSCNSPLRLRIDIWKRRRRRRLMNAAVVMD